MNDLLDQETAWISQAVFFLLINCYAKRYSGCGKLF